MSKFYKNMFKLFDSKILLLLSEMAMGVSIYFSGRVLAIHLFQVFGGMSMGWLVELYSQYAFIPFLLLITFLVAIYLYSLKKKNDKMFISCSLAVLFFYISGFIIAALLALFTIRGPLMPLSFT